MQWRVVFDFEIEFSNGGGLQGQEFRLAGACLLQKSLASRCGNLVRLVK